MAGINLGASSGIAAQGIVSNFQQGYDRENELKQKRLQEQIDKETLRGTGIRNDNAQAQGIREADKHSLNMEALETGNANAKLTGKQKGLDIASSQITLEEQREQQRRDRENKEAIDAAEREKLEHESATRKAEVIEARLAEAKGKVELALAEDDAENIDEKVLMQQAEDVFGYILDIRDLYAQNPDRGLNQARQSPLLKDVADQLADIVIEDGNVSFVDADGEVLVDTDGFDDKGESEEFTFKVNEIPADLHKKLRPAEYAELVKRRDAQSKQQFEQFKLSLKGTSENEMTPYQRFMIKDKNHAIIGKTVEQSLANAYRLEAFTDGSYAFSKEQSAEMMEIAQRVAARSSKIDSPSVHELIFEEINHPKLTEQALKQTGVSGEQLENKITQALEAARSNDDMDVDITRKAILEAFIKAAQSNDTTK